MTQAAIGEWKFNDAAGTNVADTGTVGTNNLTTVNAPAWGADFLTFNGTTQYAHKVASTGLDVTNAFSVGGWVKLANPPDVNRYVCSHRKTAALQDHFALIYGFIANKYEFYAEGVVGTAPRTALATAISDTNWHHVFWTYDGATLIGYLDGVQNVTKAVVFSLNPTAPVDMNFGSVNGGSSFFDGSMKVQAVYDRALTAAEVSALVSPVKLLAATMSGVGTVTMPATRMRLIADTMAGVGSVAAASVTRLRLIAAAFSGATSFLVQLTGAAFKFLTLSDAQVGTATVSDAALGSVVIKDVEVA